MQQILVNCLFIFLLLQIFSNFPYLWLLRYTRHLKVDTYFPNTWGFLSKKRKVNTGKVDNEAFPRAVVASGKPAKVQSGRQADPPLVWGPVSQSLQ